MAGEKRAHRKDTVEKTLPRNQRRGVKVDCGAANLNGFQKELEPCEGDEARRLLHAFERFTLEEAGAA